MIGGYTPVQLLVMIVINILLFSLLLVDCSEDPGNSSGRFPFLRRRTSSLVKRDDQSFKEAVTDDVVPKLSEPEPAPSRKFIGFGLRARTKSNDEKPSMTLSNVFSGFISTAFAGITKVVEAIDELEQEHQRLEEQSSHQPLMIGPKDKSAEIVARLLSVPFENFDHDNESDSDAGSGSSGDGLNYSRTMSMSGITIYGNDDSSSEEFKYMEDGETVISETDLNGSMEFIDISAKSDDVNVAVTNTVDADVDISSPQELSEFLQSNPQFTLESLENIRSDYVLLSDSDSESWEKVERNIIENVQVLVQKPVAVKMLHKFGEHQSIVQFLTSVFVKLARRILFKAPRADEFHKSSSIEDFVTDFPYGDEEKEKYKYKFLDFETAHRILFYNDRKADRDDWCLVLPETNDFFDALEYLGKPDLHQIDIDLPRLPNRYYAFYTETMGREDGGYEEADVENLQYKIKLILAFILAFESKELSPTSPESVASTVSSPFHHDQPILYTQGFDQIVAYFAINFELDQAGPLAYRFFQLFMAEVINVPTENLKIVMNKIDLRAVKMIRGYLRDQIGATVLNFEVLLGVLEFYPFSDRSATILYYTSATTWKDLDRLIQFLLLKVPQDQASKSISLLAAANMLYSMLALDKLFKEELGSQDWHELKEYITGTTGKERRRILEDLALRFMGNIYLILGNRIVHSGAEFDDFLLVVESLIPYLYEFD